MPRFLSPVPLYLWILAAILGSGIFSLRSDSSETAAPVPLTLESIFSSKVFDSEGGGPWKWVADAPAYLTFENAPNPGRGKELVRYDAATGKRKVLVPAHALVPGGKGSALAVEDFELSPDGGRLLIFTESRRVWRANTRGDYWVLDLSTRELVRLGGNAPGSSLMFAHFSPDGQKVAYVRDRNLYVEDPMRGHITALTTNGSDVVINATFDWVYEEELSLRDGYRWSPDGKSIAYWQLDTEGVRVFHLINNTDGLYPALTPLPYPKAGERNAAARVGVVRVEGGDTQWIAMPGDPREHYLARMEWVGDDLAIQQFNRLQNTNRVFLARPGRSEVRPWLTESDAAWIDNDNEFRWLKDRRTLIWLSERSGWRHAYRVSRSGKSIRPITRGAFDVIQIEAVDEPGGWLYFLASPDNPTQQYLYRVRLRGGGMERLTPPDCPGTHSYAMSSDAKWAFHTVSTAQEPPVTALISLPDHRIVKTMVSNQTLRAKLASGSKATMEFFRVEVEPGVELDGWCLRPSDFDPAKRYPVLFHVYGEPGGQTVLDRWGGKGQLWHRYLAQEGYVVISVDNRGTPSPRGRAWRKYVHRRLGVLVPADQAAAVRALCRRWPWLDPGRVAIWGWSGGGTMSLNAIFRYPEVYQTAMAVAPVPNLRLYDTIYQERYMGLPSENPEGYRENSAVHFAHQLQGNLLVIHGTGDDNCHYQGVEALVNELVAHNKPFAMMAYPNRTHGISEGVNTTRHVYETLTRFLRQHTPPGPR